MLDRNTWRVAMRSYISSEDGLRKDVEHLVGPGYYVSVDDTERPAVEKPVSGPFIIHDNGYGTIQILSRSDDKFFACVSYYSDVFSSAKERMTCEQALWTAQRIVEALNKTI